MISELHGFDLKDGFEQFPKAFDEMVLFPDMPNFRPSPGVETKIHQVIVASRIFLKEEEQPPFQR